jgi:hypothetical protein
MNNETYLDFCFIRNAAENFSAEIDCLLTKLFKGVMLNWYLDEKEIEGAQMVVAEVKGMSNWHSESEVIHFLEEQADESFWEYLQGYKMFVYPVGMRGCSCGTN